MRIFILLCCTFSSLLLNAQQSTLNGVVSIFNSETNTGKRQYVSNALVEDDYRKTNPALTNDNGWFSLEYVGLKEKETVFFQVKKPGLQVVNIDALKAVSGQQQTVKISMANPDSIAEYRKKIYEVGKTLAEQHLKAQIMEKTKEIRAISGRAAANIVKINQLKEQLSVLQDKLKKTDEQAKELAFRYGFSNLDESSEQFREIFLQFQKGEGTSAIYLLSKLNLEKETKQRDSIQLQRTKETASLLTLKADLHKLLNQVVDAEVSYKLLLKLDPVNTLYILNYSGFLFWLNRYDESLVWNQKALNLEQENSVAFTHLQIDRGAIYLRKREYAKAEEALTLAWNACQNLAIRHPGLYEPLLPIIQLNTSQLYEQLHNYTAWEKSIAESLVTWQKLAVENEQYKLGLGWVMNNAGAFYKKRQQYNKATNAYNRAADIFQHLAEKNTGAYTFELANIFNNLADIYKDQQNYTEAEVMFKKSLNIIQKLAKENVASYHPSLARVQLNLGILYEAMGRFDEAEQEFTEAHDLFKKLSSVDPGSFEPEWAMSKRLMADLHRVTKNYSTSEKEYKESLNLLQNQVSGKPGTYDPEIALTKHNWGVLQEEIKNYPEAEHNLQSAIEIYEKQTRADSAQYSSFLAAAYFNLANVYTSIRKLEAAEKYLMNAISLWRALAITNKGVYEPRLAGGLSNMGVLYRLMNKYDSSVIFTQEAVEILWRLKLDNPQVFSAEYATALDGEAQIFWFKKNYKRAEDTLLAAAKIWRYLMAANDSTYGLQLARTLNNLAEVKESRLDLAGAEKAYEEGIRILNRLAKISKETFEPELAQMYFKISGVYAYRLNILASETALTNATNIYRRLSGNNIQLYGIKFCACAITLCGSYSGFLPKERATKAKMILQEVSETLNDLPPSPEKNKLLKLKKGVSFVFEQLDLPKRIKELERTIITETDNKKIIILQEQIIAERKSLVAKDISGAAIQLGKDYGNLAWYLILDRQFNNAEIAAKKAINPDILIKPQEYDEDIEWAYSNLALALLLQNKNTEAEVIYKRMKNKPFKNASYKEVFLSDIAKLERLGISNSNFGKIKKLLTR